MPTFSKRTIDSNITVHDSEREPCLGRPLAPFSTRSFTAPGMILTCPNCATRYQADAAKFQPAGRNVRCAKCSHVWHQDAPPSESIAEPVPELVPEAQNAPAPVPSPPSPAPPPAPSLAAPPPEVIPPAPQPTPRPAA